MHLAELIDQDGHSEATASKDVGPVCPEKIPIFARISATAARSWTPVHDFVGV